MDEREVAATLAALNEAWVTPTRVRFLAELSRIYEEAGVLTPELAPALHRACPAAATCWARAHDRIPGTAETCWSGDEDGSIFWPWVGEGYRRGGVCVVLENIHHHGGWWSISDEYAIAGNTNRQLAAGKRRMEGGSLVGYRRGASAMAALASLDRLEPAEQVDPRAIPAAFERVAMVQAVKCSPLGDLSHGTAEMYENCPPRYLVRELSVLDPSVVIALGVRALRGIAQAGTITWGLTSENYRRGILEAAARRRPVVLVLPHPQARGGLWPAGQAALVANLLREPLAPPDDL